MPAPELIVVGGPNGAGKTTFVRSLLKSRPYPYLSADAIAAELAPHDVASVQVQAGREFLLQVDEALARRQSFIVESTLSGKSLHRTLRNARSRGFTVQVAMILIDNENMSISRVAERVRRGGHHVPDEDARRRFLRTYENFWHIYRPLANFWVMEYNGGDEFTGVAMGEGADVIVYDQARFHWYLDLIGVERQ